MDILALWFEAVDAIRGTLTGPEREEAIKRMTNDLVQMCKEDGLPFPRYITLFL